MMNLTFVPETCKMSHMSDEFKTIRIRTSDYRRLRRIAALTDEKLSEVVGRLLKEEATRLGIQGEGEKEPPQK